MTNIDDQKRFLANRQKEIDGAALYRVLAESEAQPQMAALYQKFADTEEKHAAAWERKLSDIKIAPPPRRLAATPPSGPPAGGPGAFRRALPQSG